VETAKPYHFILFLQELQLSHVHQTLQYRHLQTHIVSNDVFDVTQTKVSLETAWEYHP